VLTAGVAGVRELLIPCGVQEVAFGTRHESPARQLRLSTSPRYRFAKSTKHAAGGLGSERPFGKTMLQRDGSCPPRSARAPVLCQVYTRAHALTAAAMRHVRGMLTCVRAHACMHTRTDRAVDGWFLGSNATLPYTPSPCQRSPQRHAAARWIPHRALRRSAQA